MVSGFVYIAYAGFVATLIPKSRDARAQSASNSSFPDSWRGSDLGRAGLCIAGIAFLAGTGGACHAIPQRRMCLHSTDVCESRSLSILAIFGCSTAVQGVI